MNDRRPRIPEELAARIDERRGLVPFNRYVVDLLEKVHGPALGRGSSVAVRPDPVEQGASVEAGTAPSRAPRGRYGCKDCDWTTNDREGRCPTHRRLGMILGR